MQSSGRPLYNYSLRIPFPEYYLIGVHILLQLEASNILAEQTSQVCGFVFLSLWGTSNYIIVRGSLILCGFTCVCYMQSMEKRYQSLLKKHEKSVADMENLEKENIVLETNIKDATQESAKLQSSLMKSESEKEQLILEIDSLERDKVSVQGAYEQSKKEIMELQGRVQTLSSKVLLVTKENGILDAKLQHFMAERSREMLNQSKIDQEKAILEKSNSWLQEELERKTQMNNEERQNATKKIVDLSNQCCELQRKCEIVENEKERLRLELEEQCDRLASTSKQLKDTRGSFAEKQESLEQEVVLAQRLAQLYRESSDEYAKRTMELEGVVNELKVHLEESAEAYNQTVSKLESDYRLALQTIQEEREIREKIVAAAAVGSFDTSTLARDDISANEQDQPHNTSAEIYAKLIEAEERLRIEKLKTREKEIYFEDLLIEVEKRANLLQEQQAEFEKMKSSRVILLNDLEELSMEKRKLVLNLKKTEKKAKDLTNEKASLEQQVKDLGQQIAKLLHNTVSQNIKDVGNFTGGDASDVSTQYLVEFNTIEELQQNNQKLLKVNRELSIAAEATKEEAKREMQEEYEGRIDQLRNDLEDVKRTRQHAEEIFEHVVRQRDTLRDLLQGAGDLGARKALQENSLCREEIRKASCTQNESHTSTNPENLQYREMYDDLQEKFESYKNKSMEEYSSLEKDLSTAKSDLISMKKQVSQALAESEFQSERSSRFAASVDSYQKQVDSLLASNAKYQALVNEAEMRLSAAQLNLSEFEGQLRKLNNQVSNLESEKKILAGAEKRLTYEASSLSQEKFRLAAELDVLRKQFSEQEAESLKKISQQQGDLSKLESDLSDLNRELLIARSRADYAHSEILQLKEELKQTTSKLEEKLESKTADLSEMQRRASSAEARADLLQEAVRKSEEKVARLEIEKNTRIPAPQNDSNQNPAKMNSDNSREDNIRVEELQVEIKVLREELVSAQEALAASTGHAKQYETIAQTAEEALKSSQIDHEKFKRDASNRVSSMEAEVKRLRVEISKKEILIREIKQEEIKLRKECENLKHMVEQEKQNSKEEMAETYQNLEKEKEKVSDLTNDTEKRKKEIEELRKAYDAEVIAHGDAVRRVTSADTMLKEAQNRLKAVLNDLDGERSSRKQAEQEQMAKIEEQDRQIRDLKLKNDQICQLRDALQQELESLANSKGPDISNLSKTMKLLRQEREAAELNLSICEREVARLRQENSIAKRAAEEAREQLSAELERETMKKAEIQQDQMSFTEQICITRESNIALRSDNLLKQKQIQALEEQVKELHSKIDPLNLHLKEKETELATVEEKLNIAVESANRWKQRSKALSEKANNLKLDEYEQLKSDFEIASKELAANQQKLIEISKEKGEIESRLKQTETIAHRANANANAMKKQLDDQRKKSEASSRSVSESAMKQHEEKDKKILEITQEKNAMQAKVQELSKKEEVWKEKAKNLLSNCEKSNLAKKQAENQLKSLKVEVDDLKNQLASLKSSTEQPRIMENIVSESPEISIKRKLEEGQTMETANKKIRSAAEEAAQPAQQELHEVSPKISTGEAIVDIAIQKAIKNKTEISIKKDQTDHEAQVRAGESECHLVDGNGEIHEKVKEIAKSLPLSEYPTGEKQDSDLINEKTDSEDNKMVELDNQMREKPAQEVPDELGNIQDSMTDRVEATEVDLGEKANPAENVLDVDPCKDEYAIKEDGKQTDEDHAKPDSPKRKTKRTKIQWKDTSK